MPYIAKKDYLATGSAVGNGQCVTLVKVWAGAPPASTWRKGADITDLLKNGGRIPEGTVIATFIDGRYPSLPHGNHAAIFIRSIGPYIEVFDQWKGAKPAVRRIRFGLPDSASRIRRAEMYSVVQ
jgi:hypothetical protein